MPSGTDATMHAHHHRAVAALTGVAITAALTTSGVLFLVELIRCLRGRTTSARTHRRRRFRDSHELRHGSDVLADDHRLKTLNTTNPPLLPAGQRGETP